MPLRKCWHSYNNMKQPKFLFWVRLAGVQAGIFIFVLLYSSCRENPLAPSNFLSRTLPGGVWKETTEPILALSMRMRLERHLPGLKNNDVIAAFYAKRNYQTVLVREFLGNHQLDSLLNALGHAHEHGFSQNRFNTAELLRLNKLVHSGTLRSKIDASLAISSLELRAASLLALYSHDLKFGMLDPSKLYTSRFNIKLLKADSAYYDSVLSTKDLVSDLHRLAPNDSLYTQMKDSLASLTSSSTRPAAPLRKFKISKLRVNMERLRWKHADTGSTFARVNIPSFKLYAYENNKIVWSMGVCVGERKGSSYAEKLAKYRQTGNIDDRPQNHETPLLSSAFKSIQLNPKWNIPTSIMQDELYYKLRKDPNYLAEKNMKLYKGNKEIGRLDTIQWDKIARNKIPFHVKQDAGEMNALGKIKFNFDNPFSVYLHDTPTKSPFKRAVRDVSHGCVRLADPMKFASWLSRYNSKYTYDMIRINVGLRPQDSSARMLDLYDSRSEEMAANGNHLQTSSVILKKRTPVFIEYFTCWAEPGERLSFLPDIYGLDDVLLKNMPD